MKRVLIMATAAVIVAGLVGALAWDRYNTAERKRARVLHEFMTVLPDSLESYHLEEINLLFDRFFSQADRGMVEPADVDEVMSKVVEHTEAGRVSGKDLVYLMAQVGYYTYKKNPRYNLEDGSVDHPILNPEASTVTLGDSAFWADFEDWKTDRDTTGTAGD